MEAFTEYRYLYPPRPKSKPISILSIPMMEKLGYVAQKKKNGTCTLIYCKGDKVFFKTRHPELDDGNHRAWVPKDEHLKFFKQFGPNWNVFVAELLHNKGPSIKDELFIFDIIVKDGQYLTGTTFMERHEMLLEMFKGKMKPEPDQYRVHKHVTIAKVYTGGFKGLFENLGPLDEGLVFKLPKGKLLPCGSENANDLWGQKCRIPKSKTYSF